MTLDDLAEMYVARMQYILDWCKESGVPDDEIILRFDPQSLVFYELWKARQ